MHSSLPDNVVEITKLRITQPRSTMQATDALHIHYTFTAYLHLTNLAIDFRIILTTTQNSRSRPGIHSIVRTRSRNVRAINLLSTPCTYLSLSVNHVIHELTQGPINTRIHLTNTMFGINSKKIIKAFYMISTLIAPSQKS